MIIQQKFNKRSAPLVPVQTPIVTATGGVNLGILATFYPDAAKMMADENGGADIGQLRMYLTTADALEFAGRLVAAAMLRLRKEGKL